MRTLLAFGTDMRFASARVVILLIYTFVRRGHEGRGTVFQAVLSAYSPHVIDCEPCAGSRVTTSIRTAQ